MKNVLVRVVTKRGLALYSDPNDSLSLQVLNREELLVLLDGAVGPAGEWTRVLSPRFGTMWLYNDGTTQLAVEAV